jgi:rhodanese-related sulfurtransferase
MKKEELKKRLGSPDLIIVDVRSGRDWKASEFKIKSAVHEDSNDFDSWSAKYPMEKTIVIYCA